MSLLDQFRRPDRIGPQPVNKKEEPTEERPPVSSNAKVAEESLANRASEEEAA